MAPKALLEKKALEWTSRVAPEEVQQEHIVQAYRLNFPPCKSGSCKRNCRGNPNCLQGLGEKYWFADVPDSSFTDCEEPENERRTEGQCVGLRNLGATCYYNTLLQLWFHDLTVRSALYKWNEDEDPMVCKARRLELAAATQEKPVVLGSDDDMPALTSAAGVATVGATTAGLNEVHIVEDDEDELLRQAIAASMEDQQAAPKTGPPAARSQQSPLMKSVCGQLRLIFAKLQQTHRRYIDTTDFSNVLGLNTDQQQDAQEFYQLFISLLQEQLSSQSDTSVKRLMQEHYGGRIAYVTQCGTCSVTKVNPSEFFQLDVPIHDSKDLSDCIADYLKEEELVGENQYHCGRCKSKRDGTRRMELLSLPPVLNIQLMRFLFDKTTYQKKKSKAWIQFPEVLDMAEYHNSTKNGKDESAGMIYDLTGVLVHCGPSAFAGHYVAHIRNSQTNEWWQFNDEHTERLSGKLHLGLNKEDHGKLKGKKVAKGSHVSNDAYMLVYTLRKDSTDTVSPLEAPQSVLDTVQEDNDILEDWIQNAKSCQMESVESGKQRRLEKQTLYALLTVESDEEDFRFVKTSWLQAWLDEEQKDDSAVTPLDDTDLLCVHGMLDLAKADHIKRISVAAATELTTIFGGDLRLGADSLCSECVVLKCRHSRFQSQISEDVKKLASQLRAKPQENEGFWVGKMSLQRWRKLANRDFYAQYPVETSAQTTADDSMAVLEAPQATNADKESTTAVETTNGEPAPMETMDDESSPVEATDGEPAAMETMDDESAAMEATNGEPAVTKATNGEPASVESSTDESVAADACVDGTAGSTSAAPDSAQSEGMESTLTNGSSKVDDGDSTQEDTAQQEELNFNEECVCQHNVFSVDDTSRRLVTPDVWKTLRTYFPNSPEFPAKQDVCSKCMSVHMEVRSLTEALQKEASVQKSLFSSLLNSRFQDPELKPGQTSETYFVVAGEFLDRLKRFLRGNGLVAAPEAIDNSVFLCPHGSLLYNVEPVDDDADACPKLSYVTSEQWEKLTQCYSCRDAIQLTVTGRSSASRRETVATVAVTECVPSICAECLMARVNEEKLRELEFGSATVYYRLVDSDPTVSEMDGKVDDKALTRAGSDISDYEAPPSKRVCLPPDDGTSVRRSTRQRRSRNMVGISVSSGEALMEFKVKLMRQIQAAPFDQHIALEDESGGYTELKDNQKSLSALNVRPNSVLVVWVDKPNGAEPEAVTPTSAAPEEGFKGTVLVSG